ncbi:MULTISPECIES: hypothetical protein [Actinomycetes]|uniref:hypothetical protein n=1 Tax=Actinomycetes TaxID=1760 RepID=UPI0001B566D9|nr:MULTISPECIES: hypothetical protein [Actinomycetes]
MREEDLPGLAQQRGAEAAAAVRLVDDQSADTFARPTVPTARSLPCSRELAPALRAYVA